MVLQKVQSVNKPLARMIKREKLLISKVERRMSLKMYRYQNHNKV